MSILIRPVGHGGALRLQSRKTAMHNTQIDIPEQTRQAMVGLLQANLVDALDLTAQTKQAHWNVKGKSFIGLHELFDTFHNEARGYVDDIAERITALGGQAEGTVEVVAKTTRLPSYPVDITSGKDHLTALSNSVAVFGKNVRAAIDEADEAGDAVTADLFTGIAKAVDKSLWMLDAHLD
ncbi:DNA starvation/stationary phase protection protein Dps [Segnochrobactraceae bacterium EtOH-i3]